MRTPPNERLTSDNTGSPSCLREGSEGAERRCILSGATSARDDLVRLAISPDGLVLPDVAGKAPGRGAWITPDRAALELALAKGQLKGALARAFKGANLAIPDDLPDRVEAALRRGLTDRLGLEMRSGKVVLGAQRIAEQARQGRVALLLHASDSSEDGRRKLDQAWRVGREAEGSGERGEVLPLDRKALSVALGRDNVVHLGVAGHCGDTRAAARVLQAVTRLSHYVGTDRASNLASTMHDSGRDAPGLSDRPITGSATQDEYVKD